MPYIMSFIYRTTRRRRTRQTPAWVIAAQKAKLKEIGTPTMAELQAKVEAAGYVFGKAIRGEEVNMYPTGYTGEGGQELECWTTFHPTKTEGGTHKPKQFNTKTFKPLTEADFHVPIF